MTGYGALILFICLVLFAMFWLGLPPRSDD